MPVIIFRNLVVSVELVRAPLNVNVNVTRTKSKSYFISNMTHYIELGCIFLSIGLDLFRFCCLQLLRMQTDLLKMSLSRFSYKVNSSRSLAHHFISIKLLS